MTLEAHPCILSTHVYTHTHPTNPPGLSSGVAGEFMMTPGLDWVESVGDTAGSGLSVRERYCLQ